MIIISTSRRNLDYASQAPLHPGYAGYGPNDDHGWSFSRKIHQFFNIITTLVNESLMLLLQSLVELKGVEQCNIPISERFGFPIFTWA